MVASLNNPGQKIITGNDGIVLRDNFESIRGGKTLDVTGFTPDAIQEGHVVIKEDSSGICKPMPVNGGATAYAALPAGHSYLGIVVATVSKTKPFVGICIRGNVNPVAAPYSLSTSAIFASVKTALPLITFLAD